MAFSQLARLNGGTYSCLSSDTKPTTGIDLMSRAFETDTGLWFYFNGASWAADPGAPAAISARSWEDTTNGAARVEQVQGDYETVAASQTDQVLGALGAVGDFLHKLIITVATAATAATSIKDGSGSSIPILPNSPGGGIGVYVVEFNMVSTSGAWKVTTGAGVTVLAIGRFS